MTVTSSDSGHNVIPPKDPKAPQASPTGAPTVQPMPRTPTPANQKPKLPPYVAPPKKILGTDQVLTKTGTAHATGQALTGQPAPTSKVAIPGVAQPGHPQQPGTRVSAGSAKPAARQVTFTTEGVFKRLRYFENLTEHLFRHNAALSQQVSRTGTAPLALPHFEVLGGEAGDFNPNDR